MRMDNVMEELYSDEENAELATTRTKKTGKTAGKLERSSMT